MRVWPRRGWATRTLVLTVAVMVAGALVTVGNAWADQGHRRGHDVSKSAHHSSMDDRGQHDRGNDKHRGHDKDRSKDVDRSKDRASADRSRAGQKGHTSSASTASAEQRSTAKDSIPTTDAPSVGPDPAPGAPAGTSTGTTATVAPVSGAALPRPGSVIRQAAAVSSPAVAFSSVCEPGGRRVTATITNGTAEAVTASITTTSRRSTKEVAASGRASVVVHLATGKAVVIAIGGDHVSYLAPACAEPAHGSTAGGSAAATSGSPTVGLALSLERACESAGEPVAVRVTNPATVADQVVVAGVSRAVPAKATVALPVPAAGTGDVVTVAAGPTRYELTVPACTQVAPLAADGGDVLGAGLTGGAGGGLNSDLALILAGLAAVALSVGVLVVAAARRLWWGSLR